MKRILLLLFPVIFFPVLLFSQGVTTSSMSGTVLDEAGEELIGANVVAVHQPSGTMYGAATDVTGTYRIPTMRVGGPYKITVTFAGFSSVELEDLFLRLGENERRNFVLSETATELETITVSAAAGSVGENSGTSTQISTREIEELPSVDRNLNDFLRLTPQSSAYGGGGITFAGINNRYNAIYIDGAVNNDVFGLASSGTNGGQTGISPFSVDIIEQLQVVLSPYDVTLGGFAGGGINAVTKSGTNTFKGTAYTYLQNENFIGKTNGTLANRLDIEREKVDEFTERLYGFSLGGPVIVDKLFFFTNVELQRDESPIPFEVQNYTSEPGRASQADLDQLRDFVRNTYNYDPGTFGSTSNNLDGTKIFGKLDYNINSNNRITFRHQYTKAEQFSRNGGNSSTLNFSNNGIYFPSTTNSSAIEWNSSSGTNISNNLILSYVSVRDDRDPLGGDFPYVYIEDENNGEIRLGSQEFSTGNALDQDIFSITNNFQMYKGEHTLTFGTHNEFYSIYNLFLPQNYGTYRFESLDDFLNEEPAIEYNRAYSLVDDITGDGSAAAADFNAMQLGFYIQDEWVVNNQLTLSGGLRIDVPIITSDPKEDTYLNQTALPAMKAVYGVASDAEAGSAPDGQFMLSPRFGFNYDFAGTPATIRGGLGLFTSRIPFVWPGAMFNNNGLTQGSVDENDIAGPVNFRSDIQNQYTNPNFVTPSGQVDLFTKDFKYPQIFRTNLAFDIELPYGIVSTFEGIYTKTVNNILYTNINTDPTVDFRWTGTPDDRPVYVGNSIDNTYSEVYLASNTSKGYTYNLSAQFAKNFNFGLNTTLAYSYGDAKAVSEGTSSQNSSQWRGQVSIDGRNNPEFGRSDFAAGHRIISSLNYRFNWSDNRLNATTVSLFMNAQSGIPYSYVIGGSAARNINNETGSTSRNRSLVYIPASQSEINLVDYTVDGQTVTAAEQWGNLNNLIDDDNYLSERRGQYAEKNGAWGPFSAMFDVAVRHDFGLELGGEVHRLQFSLDIFNFANMLNNEWGTQYSIPGDFNNYFLYQFEGYEADGTTPQFTFRDDEVGKDRYDISGSVSRWRMRAGIRYLFN